MARITPKVKELEEQLSTLVDWKLFSVHLPGLVFSHIEIIDKNHDDTNSKKLAVFSKWLRICPDASWEYVVAALEKVNENTLANTIRENYHTVTVMNSEALTEQQQQTQQIRVTKDVVSELDEMHADFVEITENVKQEVSNAVDNGRISIETEERGIQFPTDKLWSVKTVHEYFKVIHPFYTFLNCYLIVRLAVFLSGAAAVEAKKYKQRVDKFKKTTEVDDLCNMFLTSIALNTRVRVVVKIYS